MKKIPLSIIAILTSIAAYACPVCEKKQPEILRGITHGTGPQSNWDYVIVWVAVIIVLLTLFYSLKWMLKPGEAGNNHIKRAFLN